MDAELKVRVLHGSLLEETMSRRQLHEAERGVATHRQWWLVMSIREAASDGTPARSCGMEALDEPQHRAKAKLRKAFGVWASVRPNVTPNIQSRLRGTGDGGGGTLCILTQGDLHRSAQSGRREEGNNDPTTPVEKSDHLIVARKPGNAGGAKGVRG
jgi:hypothetical protein